MLAPLVHNFTCNEAEPEAAAQTASCLSGMDVASRADMVGGLHAVWAQDWRN